MTSRQRKRHLLDMTDWNGAEHLTACGIDDADVERLTVCFAAVSCKRCVRNADAVYVSQTLWREALRKKRQMRSYGRHMRSSPRSRGPQAQGLP